MVLNVGDKFRFGGYEGEIKGKVTHNNYVDDVTITNLLYKDEVYILVDQNSSTYACNWLYGDHRGERLLQYLSITTGWKHIEPTYTNIYNDVMSRYHADKSVDIDNITPDLANYMFFNRTYMSLLGEGEVFIDIFNFIHPWQIFYGEYSQAIGIQSTIAMRNIRGWDTFFTLQFDASPTKPLYTIDPSTVVKLDLGPPLPDTTPISPTDNLRFITPYDCFLVNKPGVVNVYVEANDEKSRVTGTYENLYYSFMLPANIFYLDNLYGYIEDRLAMSEEGYEIPELRDRRLYIEKDTPYINYLEYNPHGNCYEIGCPRCSKVYKPQYGANRRR